MVPVSTSENTHLCTYIHVQVKHPHFALCTRILGRFAPSGFVLATCSLHSIKMLKITHSQTLHPKDLLPQLTLLKYHNIKCTYHRQTIEVVVPAVTNLLSCPFTVLITMNNTSDLYMYSSLIINVPTMISSFVSVVQWKS